METNEHLRSKLECVDINGITSCISRNRMPRLCGREINVRFDLVEDPKDNYLQLAYFYVNDNLALIVQTSVTSPSDIDNVLKEYKKWVIECGIQFITSPLVCYALDQAYNKAYRLNCETYGKGYANDNTKLVELLNT